MLPGGGERRPRTREGERREEKRRGEQRLSISRAAFREGAEREAAMRARTEPSGRRSEPQARDLKRKHAGAMPCDSPVCSACGRAGINEGARGRIQDTPRGRPRARPESEKRPEVETEPHNPLLTPGPSGRRNQRGYGTKSRPEDEAEEHPGTLSPEHALSSVHEAAPESP